MRGEIKKKDPALLMTQLELHFETKGWQLLWQPPYSPGFQPIELLWRNTKQFVASKYREGRTLSETMADVSVYWYGGLPRHTDSGACDMQQAGYYSQASKAIQEACKEMVKWVDRNGVKYAAWHPPLLIPADGGQVDVTLIDAGRIDEQASEPDDAQTVSPAPWVATLGLLSPANENYDSAYDSNDYDSDEEEDLGESLDSPA